MELEINNQAKNDVKELLDEYVVSPIDTKIVKALDNTNNSITKFYDEIEKINKCIISIQGDQLNQRNNINQSLDSLSDKLDSVTDINDLTTVENNIQCGIEKIEEHLLENASDVQLLSQITEIGFKVTFESISDVIEIINSTAKDNPAVDKLNELADAMRENQNLLLNTKDDLVKKMFEDLEKISISFKEYSSEVKGNVDKSNNDIKSFVEEKYKHLFYLTLSFGIVNFLGVIVAIILNFIT